MEADTLWRRMEENVPVAVYDDLTGKGDERSGLSELGEWAQR